MKKLQIPLEDELMVAAKLYAFQNGKTLKDVVTNAIKFYISPTTDSNPTTSNTTSISSKSITSNTNTSPTTSSTNNSYYDDSDPTEEELEEARATTVYTEAPIPVYIEETPVIPTYDNSPLSLDDLVPNKPKPKERVSKYR